MATHKQIRQRNLANTKKCLSCSLAHIQNASKNDFLSGTYRNVLQDIKTSLQKAVDLFNNDVGWDD